MSNICSILIIVLILADVNSKSFSKRKLLDNIHFFKTQSQFRSVIELNDDNFQKHVYQYPRNFSIVLEVIVLGQEEKCKYCRDFHSEFIRLAESYKLTKKSELFFAYINVANAQNIFQLLNISYVPQYLVFKNKGRTRDFREFPKLLMVSAENMAKALRHVTGILVNMRTKTNNMLKIFTFSLFCFGLILTKFQFVRTILANKGFWTVITLIFILVFSSGQMTNFIQGRPFYKGSYELKWENYFDSGQQFIMESIMISLIYGSCTVCIIILYHVSKLAFYRPMLKILLEIVFSGLLLVCLSFMVKVYRYKSPQYQFSLLFE